MKKILKYWMILFLTVLCGISACTPANDYQPLLIGEWKAYAFTQNGKAVDFDLSRLSFSFNEQGVYTFSSSNLVTQEAGRYHLNGDVLYTTDTLAAERLEKAVKIVHLTSDSLQFLMNSGGMQQEIFLLKEK